MRFFDKRNPYMKLEKKNMYGKLIFLFGKSKSSYSSPPELFEK
jgi:hypothetical protein